MTKKEKAKYAAFYSNFANTSWRMKQSSGQTCPKGYAAVHCGVVYIFGEAKRYNWKTGEISEIEKEVPKKHAIIN